MTSSSSAPGMQGAILLIYNNTFHASSTVIGTSKLFLMSISVLFNLIMLPKGRLVTSIAAVSLWTFCGPSGSRNLRDLPLDCFVTAVNQGSLLRSGDNHFFRSLPRLPFERYGAFVRRKTVMRRTI